MPYRYKGVECDTVEELRALTGYPMNQVLASNKELVANSFVSDVKSKSGRVADCIKLLGGTDQDQWEGINHEGG